MTDQASLSDLDERIAVTRENLAGLTEQATAFSGAADEDRNAERIAQQQTLLEGLIKRRKAAADKS